MTGVDCKVVLLGSASTGKTCLLDRYIHGQFHTKTSATIGGSFASKKEKVGSTVVTLGCWDTAGSERFATMSRMYYRKAKAAIVCFDLTNRETYDRARGWVSELRSLEEDCVLYFCGTKKDLIDDNPSSRQIQLNECTRLAEDLQAVYFETSSKTGDNVPELFQKIAKDFSEAENNNNSTHVDRGLTYAESFKVTSSWKKDPRVTRQANSSSCCK